MRVFNTIILIVILSVLTTYSQNETSKSKGNDNTILYHEDLHQKLAIEAYKLLKEEYGGDLPLRYYVSPAAIYEMSYNNLFDAFTDYEIYVTGVWNILGQYYPISPTKINSYFSQQTATEYRDDIFWDIVGRLCQLLGDMATPAHVHSDLHVDYWPLLDGDQWEHFTIGTTLYRDWEDAFANGGIIKYLLDKDDPLRYLFYTMNQITDYYSSSTNILSLTGQGALKYLLIIQNIFISRFNCNIVSNDTNYK